jgi:hypothetical protein
MKHLLGGILVASFSVRFAILVAVFAFSLTGKAIEGERERNWKKPCAAIILVGATFIGGVRLADNFVQRKIVEGVISKASSDTKILAARTQSEKLAELLLVAYSQSLSYLVRPKSIRDITEEYLAQMKWMKSKYRTEQSVAFHIFDYIERYESDPEVKRLLRELRELPYGTVGDEGFFEIGIRYLGSPFSNYDLEKSTYSGLAWEENPNLRIIWKRSQSGFSDDERQALVPYLILEQHKYSGNRDLLHLLVNAPGFLETVQEQPADYVDWIRKAASHLKSGDQNAAEILGRAMRGVRISAAVDILKALGPTCFRTFLIESGHADYVAEELVNKDFQTYHPILETMLLSPDPEEVEVAKKICAKVPQFAGKAP